MMATRVVFFLFYIKKKKKEKTKSIPWKIIGDRLNSLCSGFTCAESQ